MKAFGPIFAALAIAAVAVFGLEAQVGPNPSGISFLALPTVVGPLNVTLPASAGTPGPVAPCYTTAGAACAATWHEVGGQITAAGVSTVLTFTASTGGAFTVDPACTVIDQTGGTGVPATMTASSSASATFTSVNAHVYTYDCRGF